MPKRKSTTEPIIYALSLKQPWAALVVHGRKTIEVRRWPTDRRGRILIHAARIADDRPEAWKWVLSDVRATAQRTGGIIGTAELFDCVAYQSRDAFAADQWKHLNDAAWFDGRQMYGFRFRRAQLLPFRRYPGWMRFFPVEPET